VLTATVNPKTLLIAGASARYLVQSAVAAGWRCTAVDLFADADTSELCPVSRIDTFGQLPRAAFASGADAWLFCGGLENHVPVIETVSSQIPLIGPSLSTIRQLRDPFAVAREFLRQGIECPYLKRQLSRDDLSSSWLIKNVGSCGGLGVRLANENYIGKEADGMYFQKRIEGTPISILAVANGRQHVLIGASRQLIGMAEFGASGFAYCGNVGPIELSDRKWQLIDQMADILTQEFGMRGVFGIDLIDSGESVWPIEINPRITSSAEIFEHAWPDFSAVRTHIESFQPSRLSSSDPRARGRGHQICGKAIVRAANTVLIDGELQSQLLIQRRPVHRQHSKSLADIPPIGTQIGAKQPLITVFATGFSYPQVCQRLSDRAAQIGELCAKCVAR
jgi:predicted ATP-grasp superfamily ATP-dependent carboligase